MRTASQRDNQVTNVFVRTMREPCISLIIMAGLMLFGVRGSQAAEQVLCANEPKLPAAEIIMSGTAMATKSLPQAYWGSWESKRFWNKKNKEGPHSWERVQIDEKNLFISTGEESKDSGYRSAKGNFFLLKGEGKKDSPYNILFHVQELNNSNTIGYEKNYPDETLKGQVYIDGGKLHITVDGMSSFILERKECE